MKRQELKNLLRALKPDGDVSDTVDAIMELNGADIENAKKSAGTEHETLTAEIEGLKAQLKAYEKGGEKYVDPAEIERLKNFEATTKAKEKRAGVEKAFKEMLEKHKVLPGIIARELKHLNADEVKLGEDGKITADYEKTYMDAFKADFPDGFTVPDGTGAPTRGNQGQGGGQKPPKVGLEQVLQEYHSAHK